MSSIFYGLEIAKSGLYVSQQAMNLTGNNIANASTKGFTRQRLVINSVYPNTISRYANCVTVGGGATATQIDQIRSVYIDKQLRDEYASLGEWSTRSSELEFIESIINETSDNSSITAALSDFYESLNNLSINPENIEIRTNVQQNGVKLCETLNYYYKQLVGQQNAYNDSMSVTVDSINSLLTNIASYNKQIYSYELNGQSANELRDSRNMLIDELSQLINIEYSEDTDGKLSITVEGAQLVNHTDVTLLEARDELTGIVSGEPGYYEIYLEGEITPLAYSGGQLKAYKDLRDGNTVDDIGVPYLLGSLNTLAQALAQEFNTVHETGYTIPYGAGASLTGIDFFEVPVGGYNDITAGNISLSSEVMENVKNIAASSSPIDLSAADTQLGNNEVALQLYALTSSTSLASVGSFDSFLKSFIVNVGISSASAQDMYASQGTITDNLESRRESISGVSIDEEMINMLSYQHAYSAAARVLTAIDEAIGRLINSTGRVGL